MVSRIAKELIIAFFVGLVSDIGVDAFWDWVENRPKEHVEETAVDRTQIASEVGPRELLEKPVIEEMVEPPRLAQEAPPPPRQLDGATVYTHHCETGNGERAVFEIVVFSESYNWLYESIDELEINGRSRTEQEFAAILASEGYREIMGKAQEIVVAGTASCEGEDWWLEESRALSRARTLRDWVERSRAWASRPRPPRSVHTLNLGQYHDVCGNPQICPDSGAETTWGQRKIILMAILERDVALEKQEIEACIKDSMRKDEQLDFLMSHYCRYDLNTDLNGNST